jgi:tRNA modification GTPase
MPSADKTYLACLTPPGAGAIASLAVRGPRAWKAVCEFFKPRTGNLRPEPGRVWLGRFGEEIADQVVMTVKAGEPLPWVEIHCHGGPEVVRLLQEMLQSRGVLTCSWLELDRWFEDDRLRTAAVHCLVHALTVRTAAIALDQYRGSFRLVVETIVDLLERGKIETAGQRLAELRSRSNLGRHLNKPWKVVVAGAPNVGKSSLVNALAGYQRCIVSPTPGTTRDLVSVLIAVDGWPVELTDTAGLRQSQESLEQQGVDLARSAITSADLRLWLLDSSSSAVWPDPSGAEYMFVLSKIDLPAVWDRFQAEGAVAVSAHTGQGLSTLCDSLSKRLVPQAPPPGEPIPFAPQLADAIEEAARWCDAGRTQAAGEALQQLLRGRGIP